MAYRVIQWATGHVGRAAGGGYPRAPGARAGRRLGALAAQEVATAPIHAPAVSIAPGTVAAQRFSWHGTVDGKPVISARVNWLMGERDLDPPWSFGSAGERFEIEVEGEPSVRVTVHGLHPPDPTQDLDRNPGLAATAMHCVNAIPYVCRAAPGIRTYLDLPLVSGRDGDRAHWTVPR